VDNGEATKIMAIDFDPARMSGAFPGGDVEYPTKYDAFVLLNETAATEIENARENEASLLLNLTTNYFKKSTLLKDIDGGGTKKFTSMPNGTAGPTSTNYATVAQVTDMVIDPAYATKPGFNGNLNTPNAQLRVSGTSFGEFEYASSSFSTNAGNTLAYCPSYNKTYGLNWDLAGGITIIDLDYVGSGAPVPVLGDRLRFLFLNGKTDDGIQAGTRGLNGVFEKIIFGETMPHVIYDIVYTGAPTGWFFKNVILGA
jgi:hypothetical protein